MVNEESEPLAAFWKTKTLEEMDRVEWESLCDGCGICCLLKLVDEDDDTVYYTSVACGLLDRTACRCTDYDNRKQIVPSCIALTPTNISEIPWLPTTCAYRLIAEGQDLYWWHHLISGSRDTVHEVGVSVSGKVIAEHDVPDEDLEDYIIGSTDGSLDK